MKFKKLVYNNSSIYLPSKIKNVLNNKNFKWLLKAEFDNSILEIVDDKLIWIMGTWYNGHWHGDEWLDGTWYNGYWHNGTWHNGTWYNGTWIDGMWKNGVWKKGNWKQGKKLNSYKI